MGGGWGGWKVTLVSVCVHFFELFDTQTQNGLLFDTQTHNGHLFDTQTQNGHRAWQLFTGSIQTLS